MLTPLTGEKMKYKTANTEDDARSDIAVQSFWSRGTRAFLDIRVYNPLCKVYATKSLTVCHKENEDQKKRAYNERIVQVERGTFTPLVFTCFGGQSHECSRFYKELYCKLAIKRNMSVMAVTNFVRTKLSFTLLKSTLLCLRGTRSKLFEQKMSNIDFTVANCEAGLR